LPWRYLGIKPGMRIGATGDNVTWRVRQMRFEAFVVHLELERCAAALPSGFPAASGRALVFEDVAPGPTVLAAADLPTLPGESPGPARLWIAAAGAGAGWRRTSVEASVDGGITYLPVGSLGQASLLGVTLAALPDGTSAGWDRFSSVDVEMLSDRMWLESRPESSVLAGANLAMIGDELVQFTTVEAIAPRIFRLSGLLRGRRGSEGQTASHRSGERFLLLDQTTMLSRELPTEALGSLVRFRPVGGDDGAADPIEAFVSGRAARPLSPAHLRLHRAGDDIVATWIRRSRDGFGWADFVDAPLAEATEQYRIEIWRDGVPVRQVDVGSAQFVYARAMQLADGGGSDLRIIVRQLSALVGPGDAAVAEIRLLTEGSTP
jgi:hypothetical protein